jgi:hypothetical protein
VIGDAPDLYLRNLKTMRFLSFPGHSVYIYLMASVKADFSYPSEISLESPEREIFK